MQFPQRFSSAEDLRTDGTVSSTYMPTSLALYGPCVGQQKPSRSTRPVFVIGCPRSGTTLLQHMILSSGDFAFYPWESSTFSYLGVKFRHLTSLKERKNVLDFFVRTERFAVLGLERNDIESRVLSECVNIGDFLRIVMEEMCRKQAVHRWMEKTPDHALYISNIKQSIPDALIVHIIRDGRDVALSLANRGGRRFLWRGRSQLLPSGVFWKWIVQKARAGGRHIGQDYYELHYEDLVTKPREMLAKLGDFIGHDLDYDRILRVGSGCVSHPNTSFPQLAPASPFNPIGRWKTQCPLEELAMFESLVGDSLEELGYSLSTSTQQRRRPPLSMTASLALYVAQLEMKVWIKTKSPFGALLVKSRYQM